MERQITLTPFEAELISRIKPMYKYIVRRKDGGLELFEGAPLGKNLEDGYWLDQYCSFADFPITGILWKVVKWEDNEATSLDTLREIAAKQKG